ncbi:MAG: sigma 54-interacting transcriptional regulator [Oscillospiraceae bacterium]|nr:sigma 54-interacting transcriptional regulator [Oscillospiraceae bacterium]
MDFEHFPEQLAAAPVSPGNVALQKQMKTVWKDFLAGRDVTGRISARILKQWEHCRALGTDPYCAKAVRLTDQQALQRRLKDNEALLKVSIPAIDYLYQFISKDEKIFVAVSDLDGWLLAVSGNLASIDPVDDITYTNWSEQSMGNNPIGTSLAENRPARVDGYEHYCIFPHHFAGAGAPIHDPDGKLIGAISITNLAEHQHFHTLGMITMAAYAIEKQLQLRQSRSELQQSNQHKNVIMSSVSEGLMVLNSFNRITYLNRRLCGIMNVRADELMNVDIGDLLPNKMLLRSLSDGGTFTDYVTKLQYRDTVVPCILTCRQIESGGVKEKLLIVNERDRMDKLAQKLTATKALSTFDTIVGASLPFRHLVETAKSIAETDSNVLLLGESGTGKDVFAQAIHNYSARHYGPFVPINCGAIPKELINTELFGYVEGAFTGAKKGGKIGQFEMANEGTIFLDEIGELPLEMQPVLLRALESRTIHRVGDQSQIPINVRIICATNKNLLEEVRAGRFREDLYYRLNVFSLNLMALRERQEDIGLLATHFMGVLGRKYGKAVTHVTDEAMQLILQYGWPGNIRELRNCIERCVALTKTASITADLLPDAVLHRRSPAQVPSPPPTALPVAPAIAPAAATKRDMLYDADALRALLAQCHWNISLVSAATGATRATVYRRMALYNIKK